MRACVAVAQKKTIRAVILSVVVVVESSSLDTREEYKGDRMPAARKSRVVTIDGRRC